MSFGKAVVKCRHFILIAALLLLIPAAIGYKNTRINYDMLIYLPESIGTIRGQHILEDEFGTGAIAMVGAVVFPTFIITPIAGTDYNLIILLACGFMALCVLIFALLPSISGKSKK